MRTLATLPNTLTITFALAATTALGFEKQTLTDDYYCDGITHGDIDRDGAQDIVAGPFWFEGPDFKRRHEFYKAEPFERPPSPTDSMFSFVDDFDGDGWPDILVCGRVHKHAAYWYQNPAKNLGAAGHWKKHYVFERIRGESPTLVDIDADGKKELICHWDNRWGWVAPDPNNPTNPWKFHAISTPWNYNQFYHGTGVGDVDGDGRPDLIINDGWWRQPEKPAPLWKFHKFKFGGKGGAQMFAYDVDGDGDNDIITSLDAHGWGLAWFEQVGGKEMFVKHIIMGSREEEKNYGVAFSQPHALDLADIDGDGLKDIVVGKRRWAHGPEGDIEPNAPPVIYWFRLLRLEPADGGVQFLPLLVDKKSGVGVQVTATDVDGDKEVDILAASKLGSFFFKNSRKESVTILRDRHPPTQLNWAEKMTLLDAVAVTDDFSFGAPKKYIIYRGVETIPYDHKDVSGGRINPGLKAGDIIVFRPARSPLLRQR